MKLKIRHFFHAAHQLPDTPRLVTKECARLHGHTYAVDVEIDGSDYPADGMVVDFKAVKQIVDKLDHRFVNDVFREHYGEIDTPISTAENIAKFISEEIEHDLGFEDSKISVCEGYKGDQNSSWVVYGGTNS